MLLTTAATATTAPVSKMSLHCPLGLNVPQAKNGFIMASGDDTSQPVLSL